MSSPSWVESPSPSQGAAPDATHMGAVELLVRDLEGMRDFYQRAVTLDLLDQQGDTVTLGSGGRAAVVLRAAKDLPDSNHNGAGLYHSAIVFQDRPRLATALASMASRAPSLYQGSADHLVSEAFYFGDPEGNGLELYRDRPREEWTIGPDGSVAMATNWLDPNRFLEQWFDPEAEFPTDSAVIGHVHLQVGDIAQARRFYEGVLGFDVTFAMPNALFLSAGGYHHHIGMNTWHSAGAGPRAAELGLGDVRIAMPTRDDIEAFADRLRFAGLSFSDDGQTLRVEDPWGTMLAVSPS